MLSLFSLSPSVISDYWYGPIGARTAAGIPITDESAMTYSAVWACTRVLSASGSCLPLNLHRRSGAITTIDDSHPVHALMHDEPNKEMGSMGMRSIGLMRQINNGNFFAEIVRDALRRPRELWPIANDRVTPIRPDEQFAREKNLIPNRLSWQVKREDNRGYDYLRDEDMLNVRSIISDDGIMGKGVITNARETIAHGLATVQQGAAYMKNSARPSVVISGGKFKTGEDRETYRRMWMDVHGGPENNAKPALLPEGAEMKVLSFSPEDSQFIQTLQHSIEDVARWYGVPPHAIGHLLRATFSNIEHLGIEFVVYSLVPWLKLWEEEIKRKLLTDDEKRTHYAKHNVNGLLRGDSAARAAYYQSLWQLGAYSINEIRELEDMNPIDGGDEHFIQTSYATLENVTNPPEPPAPVMPMIEEREEPMAAAINGLFDYLKEREAPAPIIQPPDVKVPDELTQQIASLVEYTKPRCNAKELASTIGKAVKIVRLSVSKEINAIERATNKEPKEFFGWVDSFYDDQHNTVSESLSAFIVDADNLTTEYIQGGKDSLLNLTEIQAEDWPELPGRFAELAKTWRDTRVEQFIGSLVERVMQ